MTHPFVQFLSRPRVRIGLGASAVIATVAFVSLGAFAAGGEAGGLRGPGLNIAVVPPVERDFDPGSTMEVGALSDGFDRAALERRAEMDDYGDLPLDAYAGDVWSPDEMEARIRPMPVSNESGSVPDAQTSRGDALADGSRAFGFDRPQPDYAAERAQRLARLDAASSPRPTQTGPVAYTDVVQSSSE